MLFDRFDFTNDTFLYEKIQPEAFFKAEIPVANWNGDLSFNLAPCILKFIT